MDLFPFFPIDSSKIILNCRQDYRDFVHKLVYPTECIDEEIESKTIVDEINKFMAFYQEIHVDEKLVDMADMPVYDDGEPERKNTPEWIAWARNNIDLYYEADFFLDFFESVINDWASDSRKKHSSWSSLKKFDIGLILGGLSEYFLYLPYIDQGIDPTIQFKSFEQKNLYKIKIYKELLLRDEEDLVNFVDNVQKMTSISAVAEKMSRDISDSLIWFGNELPSRRYKSLRPENNLGCDDRKVIRTKEALEVLWQDQNHPDYPPELVFASWTWSAIYQHHEYPRLSHSRAVEVHLKKHNIPKDQRFIDRVTTITTPARLKTGDWKLYDPNRKAEKKEGDTQA